jgi:hypothetical protein
MSTKRTFNDTTVSSGIITERKKESKRKQPSCFLCVSYTLPTVHLNPPKTCPPFATTA